MVCSWFLFSVTFLSSTNFAVGNVRTTSDEGLSDIFNFTANHQAALDFILERDHHCHFICPFSDPTIFRHLVKSMCKAIRGPKLIFATGLGSAWVLLITFCKHLFRRDAHTPASKTNSSDDPFLQKPETAALFIVRFIVKYIFTVLFLIGLNLVIWDREDTRPSEELNLISQINTFTDPSSVASNMYITSGMVRNNKS